jgi:hypothetical protein
MKSGCIVTFGNAIVKSDGKWFVYDAKNRVRIPVESKHEAEAKLRMLAETGR